MNGHPERDTGHEHDLGLAHDLWVMSRRKALFVFGAAGTATVAAACSSSDSTGTAATTTTTATSGSTGVAQAAPQETAGPYPGDGSNGPNVLIESGVVRSDIRSSFGAYSGVAEGIPATITLELRDLAAGGSAGSGLAVYIWHCDRDGEYSLYGRAITDQNYLRGVQVADATGRVSFTSIFPACYSGRWPHIHFEVFDSLETAVAGSDARLTSQIALPQDACGQVYAADSGYAASRANLARVSLDSDNVFGDGWTAELATVTGTPSTGMTIAITVGVAAKSENTAAGNPPPGPSGGSPGGNGAPGGPPPR